MTPEERLAALQKKFDDAYDSYIKIANTENASPQLKSQATHSFLAAHNDLEAEKNILGLPSKDEEVKKLNERSLQAQREADNAKKLLDKASEEKDKTKKEAEEAKKRTDELIRKSILAHEEANKAIEKTNSLLRPSAARAPTKPIEDFSSAVAAAKEEAQQKIAQSRQQSATSKEDNLARQEAHALEREAKKEANQAAGTRAATEGRDASKAMREITGMGQPRAAQTAGPIPDVEEMSDAPLSDPNNDDSLFNEAKAATGRADPNLVAPSLATLPTQNSSNMRRFGSLVGALPPTQQQRVTNPYTQPIARSNPTEVEAIRDAEAREKLAQENATINAFPSQQLHYDPQDLDENVDTQAAIRDQLLQTLFQSLKIPYPELPLEQIFADESATKLKSDQQLMDFLRHQFDLDDVKKMQDYSTGIKNTENEVGNTLRDLVRQDTISEQTNPYIKAGTENITGDALKEFSNPQVQERMDFLRRIALEQFKEAAEERKKEFTSNLHRQFPGHSFFNSARVAAEKKFMDAELRREKDLEDRLLNERFNAEEAERNRAERILAGNRQNNLSGAETASKVASMANVARNSAAQSLMSHAREKRQNHLQGINTIRGLGGEETARTQEKMNVMNAQRANAAANSRNLPAQLLAMTNEAPYPGLPYDQAPTYVAPPIRSRAGEMYAQTKMNSGAGTPSSGGSDLLNTGVNAASTILQNVLGTRK